MNEKEQINILQSSLYSIQYIDESSDKLLMSVHYCFQYPRIGESVFVKNENTGKYFNGKVTDVRVNHNIKSVNPYNSHNNVNIWIDVELKD